MSFVCTACARKEFAWYPQCPGCAAWTTLTVATDAAADLELAPSKRQSIAIGHAAATAATPHAIADVELDVDPIPVTEIDLEAAELRYVTTIDAFDHVLGNGLVPGACVLLGGDPGAGKSTLLIQALAGCARWNEDRVLYATGEETLGAIAARAHRVGAAYDRVMLLAETDPDVIIRQAERIQPIALAIDSISTMARPDIGGAPGSVSQVRACAELLRAWCKEHEVALILIAHVTKDGAVAGPSSLKHLVDTVLHLDLIEGSQFRVLRAHKHRHGNTASVGRFEMTATGMQSIANATPNREPLYTDRAEDPAETAS